MRNKYRILALWINFFGIIILLVPLMVIAPTIPGSIADNCPTGSTIAVTSAPASTPSPWDNTNIIVPQEQRTSLQVSPQPVESSVTPVLVSADAISKTKGIVVDHIAPAAKAASTSRLNLRSKGLKTMAAPDFTLTTLSGKKISLSSLKGKNVMLNFWATWCGPCANEMPYIQSFYDKVSDQDLVVLTVNYKESEDIVREYAAGANMSMPVLLDPNGEASRKYNVLSIPRTYFIDTEGYVQMVKFGSFETTEEIEYYFK